VKLIAPSHLLYCVAYPDIMNAVTRCQNKCVLITCAQRYSVLKQTYVYFHLNRPEFWVFCCYFPDCSSLCD